MKAALLSKPKQEAMDDEELVAILSDLEDDASDYVHGSLADARDLAIREYYQQPYLDEKDDGLSKFVTSEVQDTIEWVLPGLLRMFTAGEDAVKFEPRKAEDEDGAEQATEAANYIFYTQNAGFLTLHTAFKDALMLRNGAIEWYWDEKEVTRKEKFQGVTLEELAYTIEQFEAEKATVEIVGAEQVSEESFDEMGMLQPARVNAQLKVTKTEGKICIEAFPPEELLVDRDWRTPILDDCPYICRLKDVSLSYLRQQGWDVTTDDLGDTTDHSADTTTRAEMSGVEIDMRSNRNDEAMLTGRLRREWVLIDYDGDGIAERRYIVRINKRILVNETCENVPVATGVPIMRQHRWDGLSMADTMSDLQRLKTEVTRQMLNGLYFSVTPRNTVLTDQSGVPLANVDDLLNFTPGGYVRQKAPGAVTPMVQPWVGADAFPMLQYVDAMKDNRSGVNAYFQGNDANALNKTKGGIDTLMSASQQRIELIARMLAETLVKPMFKGVFKLLLEYQIEPLSFKLRNTYVQMNPQEWKDSYDMTIQVGLGTGNKDQMLMHLARIQQAQGLIASMGPLSAGQQGPIVQPKHVYEVAKKMALNSGFKSPDSFFADPGEMAPPQPMPPPPEIVKTQMQLEHDGKKMQAQAQADMLKLSAENDFEARRIMQEQAHAKEIEVLKAQLQERHMQTAHYHEGEKMDKSASLEDHKFEKTTAVEQKRLEHSSNEERQKTILTTRPDLAESMLSTSQGSSDKMEQMHERQAQTSEAILQVLAQLVEQKNKPVNMQIQRDKNGKATGVVAG